MVCLPIPDVLPRAGGRDEIAALFYADIEDAAKTFEATGEWHEPIEVRNSPCDVRALFISRAAGARTICSFFCRCACVQKTREQIVRQRHVDVFQSYARFVRLVVVRPDANADVTVGPEETSLSDAARREHHEAKQARIRQENEEVWMCDFRLHASPRYPFYISFPFLNANSFRQLQPP